MTLSNGFAKVGYHLLDILMQYATPIRGNNKEWPRVIATTLGPPKSVGHVETQTMQTADCRLSADHADCADWVLFFLLVS